MVVLLSPLVLLELVAAAHNDLLMIGLVVAGVAFAIERRVLLGIALCALAATIKLPAAVAIPFILVAYADRRTWLRGVVVAVAVVVAVSVVSGLGFGLAVELGLLDAGQGPAGHHAGDRARVDGGAGRAGGRAGTRVGAGGRRVRGRGGAGRWSCCGASGGRTSSATSGSLDRGGGLRPRGVAVVPDLGARVAGGDCPKLQASRALAFALRTERAGRQGRRGAGLPAAHRAGVRRAVHRDCHRGPAPARSGHGVSIASAGRGLMAGNPARDQMQPRADRPDFLREFGPATSSYPDGSEPNSPAPVRMAEQARPTSARRGWWDVAVIAGPAVLAHRPVPDRAHHAQPVARRGRHRGDCRPARLGALARDSPRRREHARLLRAGCTC